MEEDTIKDLRTEKRDKTVVPIGSEMEITEDDTAV